MNAKSSYYTPNLQSMSGIDLSRAFYTEAIQPLLVKHFPTLEYAAGLIGPGSEVLGYDTEMSRDHNWGPRKLS